MEFVLNVKENKLEGPIYKPCIQPMTCPDCGQCKVCRRLCTEGRVHEVGYVVPDNQAAG